LGYKLAMHCRGLRETTINYKRYVVNGKLFRTLAYDVGRKTQNRTMYVIFKGNWADPTLDKGFRIDDYGLVFVNFNHLVHRGELIIDRPYVLTSQLDQVFNVKDGRNSD
jgi:hypothetical protein